MAAFVWGKFFVDGAVAAEDAVAGAGVAARFDAGYDEDAWKN